MKTRILLIATSLLAAAALTSSAMETLIDHRSSPPGETGPRVILAVDDLRADPPAPSHALEPADATAAVQGWATAIVAIFGIVLSAYAVIAQKLHAAGLDETIKALYRSHAETRKSADLALLNTPAPAETAARTPSLAPPAAAAVLILLTLGLAGCARVQTSAQKAAAFVASPTGQATVAAAETLATDAATAAAVK